jgi:hypothetical protein
MIYYLEYDSTGTIYHAAADVAMTIVPLIPIAILKDASGNLITPFADPVGISAATYNMIVSGGIDNFIYDLTTSTVIPRVPANASTTSPATTEFS